jgi:hypothetical protein
VTNVHINLDENMESDDADYEIDRKEVTIDPIKWSSSMNVTVLQAKLNDTVTQRWSTYCILLESFVTDTLKDASGKPGKPLWGLIRKNLKAFYENDEFPVDWCHKPASRVLKPNCEVMLEHFRKADAGEITDGPIVKFRDGPVAVLLARTNAGSNPRRNKGQPKYEENISSDDEDDEKMDKEKNTGGEEDDYVVMESNDDFATLPDSPKVCALISKFHSPTLSTGFPLYSLTKTIRNSTAHPRPPRIPSPHLKRIVLLLYSPPDTSPLHPLLHLSIQHSLQRSFRPSNVLPRLHLVIPPNPSLLSPLSPLQPFCPIEKMGVQTSPQSLQLFALLLSIQRFLCCLQVQIFPPTRQLRKATMMLPETHLLHQI